MDNKTNNIICPKCGTEINVSDILYHQVEDQLKRDFDVKNAIKDEEIQKKIRALDQQKEQLDNDKKSVQQRIDNEVKSKLNSEITKREELIRNELKEETAGQIQSLTKELELKSGQIKELNQTKAEVEKLKREKDELRDLIVFEKEKEFSDKLRDEKIKMQKQVDEASAMKIKELEKQLEDQKNLAEEMKRKVDQGSMQLQGEVQELAIEEWLKAQFPLDTIEEIKKGTKGGDCVQIINTRTYQNCGSIYYESKRTKDFQAIWIEKFKTDIRERGANIGVLVTDAMPNGMNRMGLRDGIWICSFEEFKGLCAVLRESIIQINNALISQENKGDKMQMLYNYLTGNTFRLQVEAIVEGFTQMKIDLESEKRAMQRIWKQREKQIEKVTINTIDMHSSIRGIAGNVIQNVKLLELPESKNDADDF